MRNLIPCLVFIGLAALPVTTASAQTPALIDFEGFPAGAIVGSVDAVTSDGPVGPIGVSGFQPLIPGENAAIIFDSSNPPGIDFDLGTPNEDFGGPGIGNEGRPSGLNPNAFPLGNVLILAQDLNDADGDGLVDIPNDADEVGAFLDFDFSDVGPVTVVSVTALDVEIFQGELPSTILLFDEEDNLIDSYPITHIGCNGVKTFETGTDGLGTAGVSRMRIELNGSSAIAEIALLVDDGPDDPCDEDTTPPTLTCELKRIFCRLYKVRFEASDDCGEVEVEAVIDIGCLEIPVSNRQKLLAFFKPWRCKAFWWCNLLIVKSGEVTLRVTATDEAGNQTVCECALWQQD